jgi:nucleotide-binding universal stress UspA family protein
MTIKRILVPTDFGPASTAALIYARELAAATGADLHLLHVVDDLAARFIDFPYAEVGEAQTTMEESARRHIETLLTDDDRRERSARAAVLTSTAPATAIASYARDEHIDLIVMGTHGRAPVVRMFLGAVADRVIRTAPCPVLAVREARAERSEAASAVPAELAVPPMGL